MKKDKSKIPHEKYYVPRPGYNKLTGWVIDRVQSKDKASKEQSKSLSLNY